MISPAYNLLLAGGSSVELDPFTLDHWQFPASYNRDNTYFAPTYYNGRSYEFSATGDKLFWVNGSTSSDRIRWYSLSAPYNFSGYLANHEKLFSSAMYWFRFSSDGSTLYTLTTSGALEQYSLSAPYDVNSRTLVTTYTPDAAFGSAGRAFAINTSGTKMLLMHSDLRTIGSFTLTTPWDISTAVYDNVTGYANNSGYYGFTVSPDGQTMFWGENYITPMSSPFDLTTLGSFTLVRNPIAGRTGITADTNYVYGTRNGRAWVLPLATPNDVTTSVPVRTRTDSILIEKGGISDTTYSGGVSGVELTPDGNYLFVQLTSAFVVFSLSTPYDTSTATRWYEYTIGVGAGQANGFYSPRFSADGLSLTMSTGTAWYKALLSTPYDVRSSYSYQAAGMDPALQNAKRPVFAQNGLSYYQFKYQTGSLPIVLQEVLLATAFDPTSLTGVFNEYSVAGTTGSSSYGYQDRMWINEDGTKLISSNPWDRFIEYEFGTAYDFTTLTIVDALYSPGAFKDANPAGPYAHRVYMNPGNQSILGHKSMEIYELPLV